MSDTDDIFPLSPVVVKTSHGDIPVSPMVVGVLLGPFVRILKPIMSYFDGDQFDWLDLLFEHGDTLLDAAAVATGLEPAKVRALELDEAITLLTAILEVNADFFARRAVPALEGLARRAVPALEGLIVAIQRMDGSTQSNPS